MGGVALALLYPLLTRGGTTRRLKAIADGKKSAGSPPARALPRFMDNAKDNRRKQIQETLKQIEDREKKERASAPRCAPWIMQSGLDIQPRIFWLISLPSAPVFAIVPLVLGLPWYAGALSGFVGMFGFPRWFLGFLKRRRQNVFVNDFADAIDVMVRGPQGRPPPCRTR